RRDQLVLDHDDRASAQGHLERPGQDHGAAQAVVLPGPPGREDEAGAEQHRAPGLDGRDQSLPGVDRLLPVGEQARRLVQDMRDPVAPQVHPEQGVDGLPDAVGEEGAGVGRWLHGRRSTYLSQISMSSGLTLKPWTSLRMTRTWATWTV